MAAQTFIRWSRLDGWEGLLRRAQERGVALGMALLDGYRHPCPSAGRGRVVQTWCITILLLLQVQSRPSKILNKINRFSMF
jgi:hypothetical protein